ncbi:uncharacterized protein LOC128303480 isoform X2 [Anopheles moucheti]|uniref:uncharacterized protein LOC128303480 isoform X2 n=1 Tax=Anopheles moucheti TaxID=186751 RepID=UPI0022F0BD18|nr:uncharacterized protein LOC128303480 isoform X2 [Anopheles moucheti]
MKLKNTIFGGFTVVMFYMIINTECYNPKTALEMIHQKLCVCPCGNKQGGKLYTVPSVRDANERRLLQLYLQQNRIGLRSSKTNPVPYWIGANNLAAGSGFHWSLSNKEAKTSEWNSGSAPRNARMERVCVYILGDTMQWVPDLCDNEPRQFICEY